MRGIQNNRQLSPARQDAKLIWFGVKGADIICDLLLKNIKPIGAKPWDIKSVKNYIENIYIRLYNNDDNNNWINYPDLLFFNTQLINRDDEIVYLCKTTDTSGDDGGEPLSRLYFVSISDIKKKYQQFEEKLFFLDLLSSKLHSTMLYCQQCENGVRINSALEELKKNIEMGDYDIYRLGKLIVECPPFCEEFHRFTKAALEKDKALFEKLYNEKKEDFPRVSFDEVCSDFGPDFSIDMQESSIDADKRENRKNGLENIRVNMRDSRTFPRLENVKNELQRLHRWRNFTGIDHLVIDGIDNLPFFLRYKIVTEDNIEDIVELQLSMLEDDKKYDIIKKELIDCVHDSVRKVKAGNISIAPMYYAEKDEINYLLPLFFKDNGIADCALIMKWYGRIKVFKACTIINMWEAYNDVRLLDNPNNYSWLH